LILFFSLLGNSSQAATITSTAAGGNWSSPLTWNPVLMTGTISSSTLSTNVTGTGTSFLTELAVGSILKTSGGAVIGTVASITSNTSLTLVAKAASNNTTILYKANVIPKATDSVTISDGSIVKVDVNAVMKSITINNGGTLNVNNGIVFTVGSDTVLGDFTVISGGKFSMGSGTDHATLIVYGNYTNNGETIFWKSDVIIRGNLISPATSTLQQNGNVIVGGNIIGAFNLTGGNGAGQIYAVDPNATVTISPTSIDNNVNPGTFPSGESPALISTVVSVIYGGDCSKSSYYLSLNNGLPSISGTLNICVGSSTTLIGSASPDTTSPWTSANQTIATINNTGFVLGVASGTSLITYKNTNGCITSKTLTVNTIPTAPILSSNNSVCSGSDAIFTISGTVGTTVSYSGVLSAAATIASGGFVLISINGVTTDTSLNLINVSNGSCTLAISATATVKVYGKAWNGSKSSDWNTNSNWTPAAVPTANDCVLLPSGTPNKTMLASGGNALAYTLLIKSGSELSISSGSTITVTDKVTVEAGGKFLLNDSASLVQTNAVANSGAIDIIRITNPMYRYDYTYWSSPVSGFTLGGLSPLTSPSYYLSWTPTLSGGSGNWKTEGVGTTMLPAVGYAVRAPQTFSTNAATKATYTATFNGVANNGTIPIAILKGANANLGFTPTGGTTAVANSDDEWNLIGNPYPSGLDAKKFLNANAAVLNGTLYIWTHNSPPAKANADPFYGDYVYNYAGSDYATFNSSGFVATQSGISIPNFSIASGQAFFVKALTATESIASSKTATFTNDMRIGSTNASFFKQADVGKTNSIEKNRIWLNLTNSTGAFSQTLVGYIEGASMGIDRDFDGQSFGGNFVSFYSVHPEMNLTIQGRPLPFDVSDQVALGYKSTIKGSFSIRIDHLDGFFQTQNIYLEDKLTNLLHDLKASPYVFSTEIGSYNDRFVLRYTSDSLANSNFASSNSLTAFINNKELQIIASELIEEILLYEISGKLVQTQKGVKSKEFKSAFPFAKGVYFAKIKLENGIIVSKKLMH